MWPKFQGKALTDENLYWVCHYLATYMVYGDQTGRYKTPYPNSANDPALAPLAPLVPYLKSLWTGSDSLIAKMVARKDEVPDTFETFVVNSGGPENGSQQLIGYTYMDPVPPTGRARLRKVTA